MSSGVGRRRWLAAMFVLALAASACGVSVFKREYEYEEELYLSVDGSATLNVNASIPALAALRGVDLDVNPRARLDRVKVRELFTSGVATVTRVSASRRDGRRFVHITVKVDDVRRLQQVAPLAWSTYSFARKGDVLEYTQRVGGAASKSIGEVGWTGRELVAFRLHLPSEIENNNAVRPVQRGNILEWEQSLRDRMNGVPLALEVSMQPNSILYSTLLLFGATIVAAAITFALVIWWIVRRGREAEMAESRT